MIRNAWEGQLRRALGGDVQLPKRGCNVTLLCSRCVVDHTLEYTNRTPISKIVQDAQRAGWTTGSKLVCPAHTRQKPEPKETPMASKTTLSTLAGTSVLAPPTNLEQTPDAKRTHRAVFEALMIAYDDETKRYTSGYTDAKVAEETGAHVGYVIKLREDYFGPLAEPAEIDAARKAIDALNNDVANLRGMIAAVENAAKALETTIADQVTRLDQLVRKNGWKQ